MDGMFLQLIYEQNARKLFEKRQAEKQASRKRNIRIDTACQFYIDNSEDHEPEHVSNVARRLFD